MSDGKGITQEQAWRARKAAWRPDTLVALHRGMRECLADGGDFMTDGDWAFVVNHETKLIAYRSFTPADVERMFSPPVDLDRAVVCYTDGSGFSTTKSERPAGIGIVVYHHDAAPQLIAENIGIGTNNRAELCAIWRALRAVPDTAQRIVICSDSEYAIGALTETWARNKNEELITHISVDLAHRRAVEFKHVKGHDGIEGNEIADSLASIGRKIITTVSIYEG